MEEKEPCDQTPYREIYDEYIKYDVYGAHDSIYNQTVFDVNNIRRRAYVINKPDSEVWDALAWLNKFSWKVFDRLRHVEEVFFGLFKTDNKEFQLIFPHFIKHALFSDIYLIHSEELKNFELKVLEKYCQEQNQDPIHRLNKAIPESNFRLFRRIYLDDNKYTWESVLCELKEINIDPYIKDTLPIRCTFNEGQFFVRLHHLFKEWETMKQAWIRLFFVCNTCIELQINGTAAVNKAIQQLLSVSPIFINNNKCKPNEKSRAKVMDLVDKIPMVNEYYDVIENYINDALNWYGLGGDDSTKCERITTGENFRAMQPNMTYQQTMLAWFNNVAHVVKERYKQEINFELSIQPSENGVPMSKEGQAPEPVKKNDNQQK